MSMATPARPTSEVEGSSRFSVGGGLGKPQREKVAIIPVTSHLLAKTAFQSFQLEGSDPSVYGMPLSQSMICFTGCIESRTVEPTNVTLKLDDGTGTVTCKKFSTDTAEKEAFLVSPEFSYVHVIGRMVTDRKSQSWYISIVSMRPTESADDISLGLMEAFNTAMHPPTTTANIPTGGMFAKAEPRDSIASEEIEMRAPSLAPVNAPTIKQEVPEIKKEMTDAPAWLKPDMGVRNAVIEAVKTGGEEGIHKNQIQSLLGSAFAGDAINQALAAVSEDGEVWTTKDEDTFSCI